MKKILFLVLFCWGIFFALIFNSISNKHIENKFQIILLGMQNIALTGSAYYYFKKKVIPPKNIHIKQFSTESEMRSFLYGTKGVCHQVTILYVGKKEYCTDYLKSLGFVDIYISDMLNYCLIFKL